MMQQTWLGGDAGGCRTCPALGLSTVQEIAVVLFHIRSRVGVFYPAVMIRLLSAILSRVGGSVVNARGLLSAILSRVAGSVVNARGDGILP